MKSAFLFLIVLLLSRYSFAIHGGRDVNLGEVPSTIGFATKNPNGKYRTFCSGTLIGAHTILTAAHCHGDSQSEDAYVIFSMNAKGEDVIALPVTKWTLHEKWDESSVDAKDPRDTFDIALVTFAGDMPETNHPAELTIADAFVKKGTPLVVAGYGYKDESMEPGEDGWPKMPSGEGILRVASVAVSDPKFSKTEMLTDEVESGTNSADSGGSAYIERNGKLILWGVTSRGLPGQDGVYTRVSKYINWILSH